MSNVYLRDSQRSIFEGVREEVIDKKRETGRIGKCSDAEVFAELFKRAGLPGGLD